MYHQQYKVITLNVNGLNNPIKRSKVIAKMKREKQDIIFWQETHLTNTEHGKLCKMGFKNSFYSSFEKGNARGVAILISNRVNFQFSSQITDKEGRYLLVKGFIDNKEVTLFNFYRPPGTNKGLIKNVFNIITTEASGVLISAGDWNINLHPVLDSTSKTKNIKPEALYTKKMLKEINMFDVWRELHPSEKSFTFFSHSHRMYSRIDYFFMFGTDMHRILKCDIGVRDVSDHAGVYLTLHLDNRPKETLWRLNTSLLNDPQCQKYFEKEFEEYMLFNDNEMVSPSTLWDAAKSVVRGKLIMWSARKKKEKEKQINDLTAKLKLLEIRHMSYPEDDVQNQISDTKQALNNIYEIQMEKRLKFIKQSFYESGPKSKKLLAWRIRKQLAERSIHKIKDPQTDTMSHELEDIQNIFESYYNNLYSQPQAAELVTVSDFLSSLDLPSVGTEQNKIMTQDITDEEINRAISRLKTGKMPGADGYPAAWYRIFRKTLVPVLKKCFNYVLRGGETPLSWRQAIISVIPKPGKDKTQCSSYRPISVLNIDYRLFASILAKRMEDIVPDLIDPDQTGFVKHRQTQDNVRRALHLINQMRNSDRESIAISLDAEKAFDSVRWKYLYLVLKRFGFNDQVIGCLNSLYCSPTARIKINGSLSNTILLERGCRQGCPLSPTLFALFIEPLAQAIREDKDITGVRIGNTQYKICLYADDILMTLSNPKVSLPKLLHLLEKFGSYSGYKLNLHKTQTLTYNLNPHENSYTTCKFKLTNNIMKYLGVQIPKDLTTIYDHNYTSITADIKTDLDRWSLLPTNMYNRIDIVKMNLLPRLLYLFQSLPIKIPPKQFNEWNRMISTFIWAKQRPRIRLQTLQLPKNKGGRALPCLEDYYRAAQLRFLVGWCDPESDAKWKEIEQNFICERLPSLLGDKTLLKKYLSTDTLTNLIINPLNIWYKILKDPKFERNSRLLRWIAFDTDFTPAKLDSRFTYWTNLGITSYCTVSTNNVLVSFDYLRKKHNLEKQDLFRYFQLRNHFDKNIKTTGEEGMNLIEIFTKAYKGNLSRKLISRIYLALQMNRGFSTMYIKSRWEKEANIQIPEDDWLNICKTMSTTSSSDLWREFTWKNTLRFFITPRIKSLQTNNPAQGRCWRGCGNMSAGHFHIFWECPIISSYWENIIAAINSIINLQPDVSFGVIYLGNIPTDINKQDRYLLQILLASSKKAITRKWLNKECPTVSDWTGIVEEIYYMERLTFSLRYNTEKGDQYWKKWRDYVDER